VPFLQRQAFYQKLQEVRGSKTFALFHSDRIADAQVTGINCHISQDHLPVFNQLLRTAGKAARIDLWLYTRGGDMNVPWPLVNAIRSFAPEFNVLVPFRAHSAGTLIAMGANKIIMSPTGELSPVDPTTANQFSPRDPNNRQSILGISVEEVNAFIEMAKTTVGIEGSADLTTVLQILSKDISPIALGNVHRTYTQIREVSKKLLSLHMDTTKESARVDEIINKLTQKLYSHLHAINRTEAKDIGLDVVDASTDEDRLIWSIYEDYAKEVDLDKQFLIRGVLGTKLESELTLKGGFIETSECSYAYQTKLKLTQASVLPDKILEGVMAGRQKKPTDLVPGLPVQVEVAPLQSGWALTS